MVDVGKFTIHGSYGVYTANWVINMLPSPPFFEGTRFHSILIKTVVNVDPFFLGLSGRESDLQRGEVTLGHGTLNHLEGIVLLKIWVFPKMGIPKMDGL